MRAFSAWFGPHVTCRTLLLLALVQRHGLQQLHLFTDGSCAWPECAQVSHAAWSIVADVRPHMSSPHLRSLWEASHEAPPNFVVLAQGLVPGPQSVPRAELAALTLAIASSQSAGVPVTIHVDAASALASVRSALRGVPVQRMAHQDLLRALPAVGTFPALEKVAAHVNPLSGPPWATLGPTRRPSGRAAWTCPLSVRLQKGRLLGIVSSMQPCLPTTHTFWSLHALLRRRAKRLTSLALSQRTCR